MSQERPVFIIDKPATATALREYVLCPDPEQYVIDVLNELDIEQPNLRLIVLAQAKKVPALLNFMLGAALTYKAIKTQSAEPLEVISVEELQSLGLNEMVSGGKYFGNCVEQIKNSSPVFDFMTLGLAEKMSHEGRVSFLLGIVTIFAPFAAKIEKRQ